MRLTDQELLDHDLSISDPEGLPGVSDDEPPEGDPFIEFQYDMSLRGTKVRCVYCKYPNHFRGVVVNYGNGQRRLVGRDCAETKHGVRYGHALVEFDAAVDRQSYLRRQRNAMRVAGEVSAAFERLAISPQVQLYDRHLAIWWRWFSGLDMKIRNHVRADRELITRFEVRDYEGERQRKQRLGSRFEQAKAEAKAAGETWQLFKTDYRNRGRIQEPRFFRQTSPIVDRLNSIREGLLADFRLLASSDISTKVIREAILRMT